MTKIFRRCTISVGLAQARPNNKEQRGFFATFVNRLRDYIGTLYLRTITLWTK